MSKKLAIYNVSRTISQEEFTAKLSTIRGFQSATLGVDVRSNS